MQKNSTQELNDQKGLNSFNLGEIVRMRTGNEKPRFIGKERDEIDDYVKQHYPDSPELLNSFITHFGAKTVHDIRDIIIYGMLKEVLFRLDLAFNASQTSYLDNISIAKIRECQFMASLKYEINPKNDK
jgi:hypothetical protein